MKIKELFEKKYDLNDLHLKYNTLTREYQCYFNDTLIPYSKLNKSSKKKIDTMQEQERKKTSERFEKLKKAGFICNSFEVLGTIKGTMSKELEALLNNLTSEENILLGIHRIGQDNSKEKIEDILLNGLKMTGHLDGAVKSITELKNNVSYYANNKTIIKELMYADTYKNSKGSILIRIPDEVLLQRENNTSIFVIDNEGMIRLNPKYIVGYIPVEANHHIETIITSSQIKTVESQNNYIFKNNPQDTIYYPEQSNQRKR